MHSGPAALGKSRRASESLEWAQSMAARVDVVDRSPPIDTVRVEADAGEAGLRRERLIIIEGIDRARPTAISLIMAFEFFEIVCIDGPNAPSEVQGKLGYVAGKGEVDGAPGVFVYDLERVWCLENDDCTSTGQIDEERAAHFAWASAHMRIAQERRDHPLLRWWRRLSKS